MDKRIVNSSTYGANFIMGVLLRHSLSMIQGKLFEFTVSLSELEAHLWEAANILRGSPVDRSDWKSYILPLLFFKYLCDTWDEERDREDTR